MEWIYVVYDHREYDDLLMVTKNINKAIDIFIKNRTYFEVWADSERLFECGCTHEEGVYRCYKYNKKVHAELSKYLKFKN
ncbi:hypothetical protein CN936_25615 [Bacillus cereus]|uniref:hypothetical protein n=1 Tax=Bacillus cereus TaxID=1396 RepID=UPI000BF64AB0|nr:hypothetical protein [Bacillus cereus]PFR72875.1 hypothetical protein COK29_22170 [Bacillus cereus]PGL90820.1 hypothetical protein CN936_25615 [Bacillus cereus]